MKTGSDLSLRFEVKKSIFYPSFDILHNPKLYIDSVSLTFYVKTALKSLPAWMECRRCLLNLSLVAVLDSNLTQYSQYTILRVWSKINQFTIVQLVNQAYGPGIYILANLS